MVRLLQVIPTLGRGGGAEQLLLHLTPSLLGRGFELEIASLGPPYELEDTLVALGATVHRLGWTYEARWNLAKAVARLEWLVARRRPNLIHAHLYWSGVYTAMLPWAPPRVMSFHSVDFDAYPATSLALRARKRLSAALIRRRIDRCVGVSRTVAEHYRHHFQLANVEVIPDAIPTDRVRPRDVPRDAIRARYGVSNERCLVVMPGRLVPQKGHRYVLDAAEFLRDEPITLLMIGQGPLGPELEAQIRDRNLQSTVELHGVIPHGELLDLMLAADVVTMPSIHEGFGIVAAEAMSLERPFVGTQIGCLEEFVEHGVSGFLVPPRDPRALAEQLRALCRDPALGNSVRKRAREVVLERFSVGVVADRWAELYGRLTART